LLAADLNLKRLVGRQHRVISRFAATILRPKASFEVGRLEPAIELRPSRRVLLMLTSELLGPRGDLPAFNFDERAIKPAPRPLADHPIEHLLKVISHFSRRRLVPFVRQFVDDAVKFRQRVVKQTSPTGEIAFER
jgi:hypothetical protein